MELYRIQLLHFFPVNIILLRFTRVDACVGQSLIFFFLPSDIIVHHDLFIHSPFDGYVCGFEFGALTNNWVAGVSMDMILF